jgi:hypothetical protein
MTLPTGALSMSQIATELGRSLPLGLQDPMVRALAQVTGAACDFNSLRGKTGRIDQSQPCVNPIGTVQVTFPGAIWFGGGNSIALFNSRSGFQGLVFDNAPNWSGNISARNNTTGAVCVLSKTDSTNWTGPLTANLLRLGQTDNFTILPSA